MKQRKGAINKLRPSRVEDEYPFYQETPANWRCQGRGPAFIRVPSRLIYYDRAVLERFFSKRKLTPRRAG